MKLKYRNELITQLRDKGFTLEEIGREVNLTSERVRQIIEGKDFIYCEQHNIFSKNKCKYCNLKKNYFDKIKQITKHNLMDEIARLSKPDRRKEIVLQRQILIKTLKNDYGFSFHEIAKLLERDHTSIMYLFRKEIKI